MPWKQDGLIFSTLRVDASGPPSQRLEFVVQIENQFDDALVILNSDVSIRFDFVEVLQGPFLRTFQLIEGSFGLPGRGRTSGVIRAPLSWRALAAIEERREGNLAYAIDGHVLVAPIFEDSPATMGAPWEQQVGARLGDPLKGQIAQSDWVELLARMGWDETILIELPAGDRHEKYPLVRKRFDEAVKQFRLGFWPQCVAACRTMFDGLAETKTPDTQDTPNPKKLEEFFDLTKKGKALNKTLLDFRGFLNLGPHAHMQGSGVEIGRDDALLALRVSAAFLKYMSR